jgi:methionyl-tRNA formyltransferase
MAPALDAGAILSQHWIENNDEISLHQLYLKTIQIGPQVLIEAMNKIATHDSVRLENPDECSSQFTFPNAEQGKEFRRKGLRFI